MLYWNKFKYIDQRNRAESPETDPGIYIRGGTVVRKKKMMVFSTYGSGVIECLSRSEQK